MNDASRAGAAQPTRFNPARAARLDDPARFAYLPVSAIVALLDARPGALVLDFGAGTGAYAIAIARERPDLRIAALDEQPEMLDVLRTNVAAAKVAGIEPIDPAQIDGLCGRVDRIFALNVLHELGDAVLATFAALLAPNGQALVVDWNGDLDRPVGPPADHVYGPAEARERVEAFGLRVLQTEIFPYHYALVCEPVEGLPRGESVFGHGM